MKKVIFTSILVALSMNAFAIRDVVIQPGGNAQVIGEGSTGQMNVDQRTVKNFYTKKNIYVKGNLVCRAYSNCQAIESGGQGTQYIQQ